MSYELLWPKTISITSKFAFTNLQHSLLIVPFSIVPSEDAHGSEYVATCDKRRQFISGSVTYIFTFLLVTLCFSVCRFTGSAGQAIISKTSAYLVTDSRYWLQAEEELDENWHLVRAPMVESYKDWQSMLLVCGILIAFPLSSSLTFMIRSEL